MSLRTIMDNLNDLVECPICAEVMKDPRILPCVHTYCSNCLEKFENFQPESKLLCPVCRSEFTVPVGGVKSISKNFFISKICTALKAMEKTENIKAFCDICEPDSNSYAILYCHDCEQKYCKRCGIAHTKNRFAQNHKMMDMSTVKVPFFKKKSEVCPQHSDRLLEVYCKNCKSIICILCMTEKHNKHDITDVKKLSLSFQDQLTNNISTLKVKQSDCYQYVNKLKNHENEYILESNIIETKIAEKSVEIKNTIDEAVMALMKKLEYLKQEETKLINTTIAELEGQSNILLSFINYTEELINLGSDPDIIEGFDDLNKRAKDLIEHNPINDELAEKFPNYQYCNSHNVTRQNVNHALGDVSESEIRDNPQRKIGCIMCDDLVEPNYTADLDKVCEETDNLDHKKLSIKPHRSKSFTSNPIGIAIAGKTLYIIFWHSPNIESYDCDTMEFLKSITVLELKVPCDLTIVDCNFLLVSEYNCGLMHCMNLTDGKCMRWECGFENINRLSTTLNGNLLFISRLRNKLVEYNFIGDIMREVVLPTKTNYVQKALDLGNEQYLLLHHRSNIYGLSIVNGNGQITKSFSGATEFNFNPKSHVAILRCRNINYCLAYNGKRGTFYVLDENLDYVSEVRYEGEECSVFRLAIDEKKRIYLLDNVANRLIIMQLQSED